MRDKIKKKEYDRKYYFENKEKRKSNAKMWYLNYMQNPEYVKNKNLKNKEWREKRPQYSTEYFRNRYNNDEEFRNRIKKYVVYNAKKNEKNKIKKYVLNHNYRARKINATGSFTYEEWQNKLKINKYRCLFCGSKWNITIDHIIPLSKGGNNDINNLQPLCRSCNAKKHDKILFKPIMAYNKISNPCS